MNEQCTRMVQSLMNPNADLANGIDQGIEDEFRNNLEGLDKIPDIFRSLRDFTGNPSEFNSWRKSVERILELYGSTEPLQNITGY